MDLDKLPYSIFERFVVMVKSTSIPIASLFMNAISTMFIPYSKVRYILKDLIFGCSSFKASSTAEIPADTISLIYDFQ